MTKPTHARLTLDQLRETQVFMTMSIKQKRFIEAFISNGGDRIAAVETAYDTKDRKNARILSYQVFSSLNVIACLAAYYQDKPLDLFKAEVLRAYRSRKLTVAQVYALRLLADINGWGSASLRDALHGRDAKPSTEPVAAAEVAEAAEVAVDDSQFRAPKKFQVGDLIVETADGVVHRGRVTKVDAEGRILDAEEIL
jgi:hypothetical protein